MMITTQKHPFLCFLKTEASYVVYQLHPRGWLSFLLVKACCWLSVMHFTAGIILPFPETYSLCSYCACKELLRDLLRGGLPRPHAWAQLTASRCMQVISQLRWCFGSVQEALFLPSRCAGSRPFCSLSEVLRCIGKGAMGPVGVLLNSRDGKQSGWKLSSVTETRWAEGTDRWMEEEHVREREQAGSQTGIGDRVLDGHEC